MVDQSRLQAWLSVCALAISGAAAPGVLAQFDHQPHDVVDGLAISPDFANDGVAFTTIVAPNNSAPLRTVDHGWSWSRLVRGIDNRYLFSSCAVSPNFHEDGAAFLTSDGDGVYRSFDGGDTWEPSNTGLPNLGAKRISCGATANGELILLVALHEGGLYRSINGGDTWSQIVPAQQVIHSIEFSPGFASDRTVLVGTEGGRILVSRNDGADWRPLRSVNVDDPILDIEVSPAADVDGTIFVATQSRGVFRSTNRGRNFVPVNTGLGELDIIDLSLSPSFSADRTIFLVTKLLGPYKSVDAGNSWRPKTRGVRYTDQVDDGPLFYRIEASPSYSTDGIVLMMAFSGLFRTEDGANTWVEIESRSAGTNSGFAVAPTYPSEPTMMVSRYGGGMVVSEDGGAIWETRSSGLRNAFAYAAYVSPTYEIDHTFFAIELHVLSQTNDDGRTWRTFRISDTLPVFPKSVAISPNYAADGTLFVGSRQHGIFRSTDHGRNFDRVFGSRNPLNALVVSPDYAQDGSVFAAVLNEGIYRSVDFGETWQQVSEGLRSVDRIEIVASPGFSSDQTLFGASRDGLYRTSDAGANWELMNNDPDLVGANVLMVALSPEFPLDGVMMVSVRGVGVFHSADGGESWNEVAAELMANNQQAKDIRFSPNYSADSTVFIATDDRLYKWSDDDTITEIGLPPIRFEDDHQQHYFIGPWDHLGGVEPSAGRATYAASPTARDLLPFVGTGVRIISTTGPQLGIARVFMDDVLVGDIDLYAPERTWVVPVMTIDDLPHGPHVLKVQVTGQRNPLSSGDTVVIDAVEVIP